MSPLISKIRRVYSWSSKYLFEFEKLIIYLSIWFLKKKKKKKKKKKFKGFFFLENKKKKKKKKKKKFYGFLCFSNSKNSKRLWQGYEYWHDSNWSAKGLWHNWLWPVSKHISKYTVIVNWFKSYLFSRSFLVDLRNIFSQTASISCSAAQGSILGASIVFDICHWHVTY